MTINNWEKYKATHWDWACLDGCFDRGISPSDVDGIVEVNGKFLLLETKSPTARLSTGQHRMFNNFPGTVLVIWGEPEKPEEMMSIFHGKSQRRNAATLSGVRDFVGRWFRWADESS